MIADNDSPQVAITRLRSVCAMLGWRRRKAEKCVRKHTGQDSSEGEKNPEYPNNPQLLQFEMIINKSDLST